MTRNPGWVDVANAGALLCAAPRWESVMEWVYLARGPHPEADGETRIVTASLALARASQWTHCASAEHRYEAHRSGPYSVRSSALRRQADAWDRLHDRIDDVHYGTSIADGSGY